MERMSSRGPLVLVISAQTEFPHYVSLARQFPSLAWNRLREDPVCKELFRCRKGGGPQETRHIPHLSLQLKHQTDIYGTPGRWEGKKWFITIPGLACGFLRVLIPGPRQPRAPQHWLLKLAGWMLAFYTRNMASAQAGWSWHVAESPVWTATAWGPRQWDLLRPTGLYL